MHSNGSTYPIYQKSQHLNVWIKFIQNIAKLLDKCD
jgi:hypothetical protein